MNSMARLVYDGAANKAGPASPFTYTTFTTNTEAIGYDNAGGIKFLAPGTYEIEFNGTVVSDGTDNAVVQLFEGANAVSGAKATAVLAASGDVDSVAFNGLVSVLPSLSGTATAYVYPNVVTTYTVANVIVKKVG